MKIEWLFEAQNEFRDYLLYYRNKVGTKYARHFSEKILAAVGQLAEFPEIGTAQDQPQIQLQADHLQYLLL